MNNNYYKNCILCPRNCGADRSSGRGFCGCPDHIRAALASLHYYEEPFLSGIKGSGTVFFSGCNLRCVYCQNSSISGDDSFGVSITSEHLAEIFLRQQAAGAHNINLVTGTPYIPEIAQALRAVREDGSLTIPVIWNSSGYEKVSSLALLEGLVDIWLPDLKTLSPELGKRYMNAPDYPDAAIEAIGYMSAVAGPARFVWPDHEMLNAGGTADCDAIFSKTSKKYTDSLMENHAGCADLSTENHAGCTDLAIEYADVRMDSSPGTSSNCANPSAVASPAYSIEDIAECGLMVSGVCVRHLVIPGQVEDSKRVLEYLYKTYRNDIWISIMNQYTPMRKDFSQEELNRTLTWEEYEEVINFAEKLGIENCMIQMEETAGESFIPAFDGRGL